MEATKYCRKINYYETDQMGIVHHSNYIRFFEEARLDLMEQIGLSYVEMEENGLIIPVLSVDCSYKKPLHFGDEIEILSSIVKYDGLKMECAYEIYCHDELCTTGHSGHCFLDKDMKPVRMKRAYPELYTKLKQLVEA